jgi:hypothetical protein
MDRKRLLPLLATFGFVLAACPADDEPGGETESDTDPTTSTTTATGTGTDTDTATGTDTATDTDTGTGTGTDTDTDTAGTEATIRVVHASPNAGTVDIYVDGDLSAPVIDDLSYTETSPYLPVPAGDHTFVIYAGDADPAADDPVFTTGSLALAEGSATTAVAAGLVGAEGDDAAFTVLALEEGFEDPGADLFAARVVHAGADAPAVDLDVGDDDPATAELTGVEFGQDSGAAGVALTAATALQLGIRAELDAGSEGTEKVTAFTTPEVTAASETFVIATGLLSCDPREECGFGLLVVDGSGTVGLLRQNPTAYIFHGSADAGNVDVCVDGTLLLDNVPFQGSASLQVPPTDYTFAIYDGDLDCVGRALFTSPAITLAAGERYLVAAIGERDPEGMDPAFTLLATAEAFTYNDGMTDGARLKSIHGASAPDVEIGTVNTANDPPTIDADTDVIFDALGFGNETAESDAIPAGDLDLGIALDMGTMYPKNSIFDFGQTVTDDSRLWLIAYGDAAGTLFVGSVDATDNSTLGTWVFDEDVTAP